MSRSQLCTVIDLEQSLQRVVEFLETQKVQYVVIGGLANLVWGEPRTTADIDLTVDVATLGVEKFTSATSDIGIPLVEDPASFAKRNRVLPIRTSGGTVVDFILATLPFEVEAIARGIRMNIGETEAVVCTAQDLIIHKIVSERARDLEDVVGILSRSGSTIDFAMLDSVVASLARELEKPEIADKYRAAKALAEIG